MPTDRFTTKEFSRAANRREYEKLHLSESLQEKVKEIERLSALEKERLKTEHAARDEERVTVKMQDILTGRLRLEHTPDNINRPVSQEKAAQLARAEVDKDNHNELAAVDEREKEQIDSLRALDPELQKERESLDELKAQKLYDREATRILYDGDRDEQEMDQGHER